jgi:hypothetical protein
MKKNNHTMKRLTLYYGILQSLHLLTLARAGLLIIQGDFSPFPIPSAPGGWTDQALNFMFGLAGMDVIGIALGIVFALRFLKHGAMNRTLGLLSLIIFISGAIIFAVGTFFSGAWSAHPIAYGAMAVLFAPCILLFASLLPSSKASS